MKYLLLLVLMVPSGGLFADQNKQALKALDKGDFEDAEAHLIKSLEKSVVNPGAKYIYSLLYSHSSFPRYNIDSAYYFILKSINDLDYANEKVLKELDKNEIASEDLERQKSKIEGLAFERSLEKNTIRDFEYFMDHFKSASQVPEATRIRDQLAFDQIKTVNTWQAYASFIKDYPDAEQVPQAQKAYQRLLYQDYTGDGKLNSLKNFITQYPENQHRSETEHKILRIMGGLNRIEDLLEFMQTYPQSPHIKQVIQRLFHLDRNFFDRRYFREYAVDKEVRDSLQKVNELYETYLIPFFERGRYGFMDASGKTILQAKYEYIKEEYLCGNIQSDILEVKENGRLQLVNALGVPVYKEGFDATTDLGAGMVKMRKNGRYGVWHKAGFDILPAIYDEIELLASNLLKVKKGPRWGLSSVFGEELLPPQFDDIFLIEDFWIFEKDGLLAVTNLQALQPLTDGEPVDLDFRYDEVELIKNNYLLCYSGSHESLINENLDLVINSSDHTIIPMQDNWIVKGDHGYLYYHEENGAFLEDTFEDISFSEGWLAFKRDTAWTLLSQGYGFDPRFDLDSARILNDFIAYYEKTDTAYVAFYPRTVMQLGDGDEILLLGSQLHNSSRYLLVKNKNYKKIYSEKGELKFNALYEEVDYLSQGHFSFREKKGKGLLNEKGEIVLKGQFDGIGQLKDSLAPVLLKGEFGLFDTRSGVLIEPSYKKRLEKYGVDYFTGLKEDGYGFLDRKGEEVTGFIYTQIEYWNDRVALVRKDNQWALLDIGSNQILLEKVQTFEYLQNNGEKIAYLLTDRGFGIYTSRRGEILAPSFNDIINLGTKEKPVYFAEKHVPEAEFYLVVYANGNGETLKSQAFREEEYAKIVCDR